MYGTKGASSSKARLFKKSKHGTLKLAKEKNVLKQLYIRSQTLSYWDKRYQNPFRNTPKSRTYISRQGKTLVLPKSWLVHSLCYLSEISHHTLCLLLVKIWCLHLVWTYLDDSFFHRERAREEQTRPQLLVSRTLPGKYNH